MENRHLLDVDKFKELSRTISRHVEEEDILKYIRECEDVCIIPAIGLEMFKNLCKYNVTEELQILLSGGEYTGECGELKRCDGLQISLAYFVYAKMLRVDGAMLARTGFMRHDDSYSSHVTDKANTQQYNDVMNVAEKYLNSSLMYLKHLKRGENVKEIKGFRTRIKAIGD